MRKVFVLVLCLLSLPAYEVWAGFNVKEFTTSNGIRVRYRHDPSTPVISFMFSIKCGSARDKDGLEGTATLLASMMSEGTESKTVEEYASFLQDRAIELSHDVNREYFTVSLMTLRKYMEDAFAIMKESFWEPSFSDEAFERAKKEILTIIAMKETDPHYQVNVNMNKLIYKDHPYSKLKLGTAQSVKNIQVEDLKEFFKQFARKDVLVAVTGNITREEVEEKVTDLFSDMPEETNLPEIPQLDIKLEPIKFTVKQDIPQTVIGFSQKGLKYDDKKFMTYSLLCKIITERLRKDVRESNGLAYYINVWPSANEVLGLLWGMSATKNQKVAKTIEMIQDIYSDIKEKGVSEEEFTETKAYSMGSFILNFSDTPDITGAVLGLMQIDRSPEYIDIRNTIVEKITKKDVENMARDLLDPQAMTFVLYGSPEGLN